MPVILSSFKRYGHLARYLGYKPRAYSVARYQPRGSCFPELDFLAPPSEMSVPRNHGAFEDYLAFYESGLKQAYAERWSEIKGWLDSLERDDVTALLCWCPYTDLAEEQSIQFGSFACHTGLIGKMLNRHRPDIEVWLDRDREKLVDEWLPTAFKVIGSRPLRQRSLFETNEIPNRENTGGLSWM